MLPNLYLILIDNTCLFIGEIVSEYLLGLVKNENTSASLNNIGPRKKII